MVFQGCSDAVKSRAEQAVLDAEMCGVQLRIRNSPDALALGDADSDKRLYVASRPPL
jgi:hypothetical protein